MNMKITIEELEDIITQAKENAEETMRNKIVQYIEEGYTTNGLLFMLGRFNLVTGKAHDCKASIDAYNINKPIMVINPRDEE
jgi:hypothetical protein